MKLKPYFEVGHPVRMAIGGASTVFFLFLAMLRPEIKYLAFPVVVIGFVGLLRDLQKRGQIEAKNRQIEN
ncbi:MAG: hypothetical protein SH809_16275 [Rhodothermales bacterium]|nr:hypothetical protein [Rhodothermales bacterium]